MFFLSKYNYNYICDIYIYIYERVLYNSICNLLLHICITSGIQNKYDFSARQIYYINCNTIIYCEIYYIIGYIYDNN